MHTYFLTPYILLGDMALGHVLVLVQCDWPSLRDLLYLTLHRIKIKQVSQIVHRLLYWGDARRMRKIFSLFLNIKSVGEKICSLFTNWGKNMHFPFNHSIIFIPKHVIWPYFWGRGGGSNRKIYTPTWSLKTDAIFLTRRI